MSEFDDMEDDWFKNDCKGSIDDYDFEGTNYDSRFGVDIKTPKKVKCKLCGKRIKYNGISDHYNALHNKINDR